MALLTGCASIERTSPGIMDGLDVMGGDTPAETTVVVRNSGFCLFYITTGICGDPEYNFEKHNIEGGILLFQDECNTGNCYVTLRNVAKDEGKQLTNVNMVNNSLPSQGITGYIQFLGWLFEFEDVSCSGVLRSFKNKNVVTK